MGMTRKQINRRYYEKHKARKVEDGKIRTVSLAMRLPATWVARMQRIAAEAIALGNYPWRTTQEVARGLLAKGFEQLDEVEDGDRSWLAQFRLEQDLMEMDRDRTTAQNMLGLAKRSIQGMLNIGAEKDALRSFAYALQQAKELDRSAWNDWLVDQIEQTFPDMAAHVRKLGFDAVLAVSTNPKDSHFQPKPLKGLRGLRRA
jgi:hypothetical protein